MRDGDSLEGLDFFTALNEDEAFCIELGRAMLAAGKLETELVNHLSQHKKLDGKKTLGQLIGFAEKHELLTDMVPALKTINSQRNYLAHNIYGLFSGLLSETLLPKNGLLNSDIDVFTLKAIELKNDLLGLADIVVKRN
jgi:hypothetical protein